MAVAGAGRNEFLDMLMMRVEGAKDDASSASNNFRHAMEAMLQMAQDLAMMMMGIMQVLMKVFSTISG